MSIWSRRYVLIELVRLVSEWMCDVRPLFIGCRATTIRTLSLGCVGFVVLLLFVSNGYGYGHIYKVIAPQQIVAGEEVVVMITVSHREKDVDRTIALSIPSGWVLEHSSSLEAGSDARSELPVFSGLPVSLSTRKDDSVLVFADVAESFDEHARGVLYILTFRTSALARGNALEHCSIRAALIERNVEVHDTKPDNSQEGGRRKRKPKPVDTQWRMISPLRYDWDLGSITDDWAMANVSLVAAERTSRALVVSSRSHTYAAVLETSPDALSKIFQQPFSIQFWYRSVQMSKPILELVRGDSAGSSVTIQTSEFGTLEVADRGTTILGTRTIIADGAWHHILITKDSAQELRAFVDAESIGSERVRSGVFGGIARMALGSQRGGAEFTIDELQVLAQATRDVSSYVERIAFAGRDTSREIALLFHFDGYTNRSGSSKPLYGIVDSQSRSFPTYWVLDSTSEIEETTSPVQFDGVYLNADFVSPTRVAMSWRVSTELGVNAYHIERRIGRAGKYEKILTVDAKHGVREHGVRESKQDAPLLARSTYHVTEDLPKLKGDIDLYYRLVVVGYSKTGKDWSYGEPVKLEYGEHRELFVEQNDPNPFNPVTTITFRTEKPTTARLSIFDMIGREVDVLFDGKCDAGKHVYTLDATNWPSGIYFYKVRTPAMTVTRKMLLAK